MNNDEKAKKESAPVSPYATLNLFAKNPQVRVTPDPELNMFVVSLDVYDDFAFILKHSSIEEIRAFWLLLAITKDRVVVSEEPERIEGIFL